MQVVCPFASCLKDFNNLRHIPLKTQCDHRICRECAISIFEKFRNIKCPICNAISNTNPNEMKKDREMLKSFKREENFRKQAHNTFENYCSLNCKFLEVQRSVEKSISRSTAKVQRLLNQLFNQCAEQTLREIDEGVKASEKRKSQMEEIISKMEKTKIPKMISEENIQGMIDVQELEFKLNSNLQEAQILQNFLEDTTGSIMVSIEGLVRQERLGIQTIGIETQNITEGYISQIEVESPKFAIVQPLKPDIKSYSTIAYHSNNKRTFNIDQKTFTNQKLKMPATFQCNTYIEQINEAQLLISGFNFEKDFKQFRKYKNGDIQRLEMNNGRYCHRTVFNNQDLDFIISGFGENNKLTEKCEVFNFSKNTFTIIKDIPDPCRFFGCSFIQQQVLTFGGYFGLDHSDKIQSYNPNQNSWEKLQHKIPKPDAACSVYLKEFNSCLVYCDDFESQMFDLKSISRHGEVFKGYSSVFTNAINSNNAVYQFDCNTVLYFYELNNAKWEEIE